MGSKVTEVRGISEHEVLIDVDDVVEVTLNELEEAVIIPVADGTLENEDP